MIVTAVPLEHTFKAISEYPEILLPPLIVPPPEISNPFSFSNIVIPEPAKGFVHSILLMSLLKKDFVRIDVP